ncbi:transposase [Chryseobacterium formosus]|uniref:Transposase n=1 Tax=Chryseobacterium formosus TaxID=1537363 RepID=A0ABT3XUN9_9FLAO|nr:transposase [Chryseobacterium formosus]MCX8525370.1 transposase [Chryseobacterium formosus]
MNFKQIHIGSLIQQRVRECELDFSRICNFLKCNENDIRKMYNSESLDTKILLSWSKLLEYDFFRIYSQHLILFSAQQKNTIKKTKTVQTSLPSFRKNVYTKEIIDFILNNLNSGKMTSVEIIETYNIPKTTLYKWVNKYNSQT